MMLKRIVPLLLVALLSACASDLPVETFSNDRSRNALLEEIPVGTPMANAQHLMEQKGYSCGMGSGYFRTKEALNTAPSFMSCQSNEKTYAPLFMFDMKHRWTVYFINVNGKVNDIVVDMNSSSTAG